MKALTLNALKLASLLLALGAADAALADRWDTLGSKHSPKVQRFGSMDQHPGRGLARGHELQRSQITIVVAPRAPINAWAPRWDDRRNQRHQPQRETYVFNSSLGYIAGSVIGLLGQSQLQNRNDHWRSYNTPTTVIRHAGSGLSISLYKDRFGACYEREEDRHGRVVKRRVANYNCNF